jgi:DNA-binding CsgD family transcriptional regulator
MMMDETSRISNLIGDIYDAALDPELWPKVLEQTCGYIPGIAAALNSHDALQKSAQFQITWGDDPHFTRLYNDVYVRLHPALTTALIETRVGHVWSGLDVIPRNEYESSRIYKEWAAPQGYIDVVVATLDKSASSFAAVMVMRHERHGLVDAEARHRMGLLSPHFRRSVAIGKVIDLHKVEAAALGDTLDGLAAAVFLVNGSGRIVHANAVGHAMLAEGSTVCPTGDKLAVIDANANQALRDVITNADGGDAAVGVKGIAVPLSARDGERYVAHVLPLTSGARRKAGIAYSAVAAVFVRKAALDLPHPLEAIASAFKLTPAEMRVLMMIVEVGGVPEVASVLGISEPTVRTHLQHVFQKTETSRQAELVKLVAGYLSPLGG